MSGISSVPAGTSRRAGGVNVQRPQRSVSGARTNDVCDTRSHSASERIGLGVG